jgi:hypothetical protein
MRFSIPDLVRDVNRFSEARDKWQKFLKWENYSHGLIGNKEKKDKLYSNYIRAMRKLEKKYNPNYGKNINQPEFNNWVLPQYNPDAIPSAPVLE